MGIIDERIIEILQDFHADPGRGIAHRMISAAIAEQLRRAREVREDAGG